MSDRIKNYVREISTSQGTGNFALTGAASALYFAFTQKYATGASNKFYYTIEDRANLLMEIGIGYLFDGTTLVRDTVLDGSNGTSHVNFPDDSQKVVFIPLPAEAIVDRLGANTFPEIQTFAKQIVSTLATGTAPLGVTSTTVCTNLNADMVDGQHGPFATAGHAHALDDLTDVTVSSPASGHVLSYNGGWFNMTLAAAGIASSSHTHALPDMTDVDNAVSPGDGSFLVGNGTSWITESGNTARTSLGLGTGDSPQFTDLTLTGNLVVHGTSTTLDTANLTVEDPLIELAKGNSADTLDVGFYGQYVESATTKYRGLFYDPSTLRWEFFTALTVEPTTSVDTSHASYLPAQICCGGAIVGTLYGGDGAGDDLSLTSTQDGTKGLIIIGASSAYDEVNHRLGINTTAPDERLHVVAGNAKIEGNIVATGTVTADEVISDTITGATTASGTLALRSTSHATKGLVTIGAVVAVDETAETFGITGTLVGNFLWQASSNSANGQGIANAAGTRFVTFDSTNRRMGLGTSVFDPSAPLHIISSTAPTILLASSQTDNANKAGHLGVGHYDVDEEPVTIFMAFAQSTKNEIWFGGGSSVLNAATDVIFYTAANTTTLVGTSRMHINPDGNVMLTASAPGTGATVNFVLGGGTTSPVLGAAASDRVHIAGVDFGAGNRELQVQPELGGILAWGNNVLRRVLGTGVGSCELYQARVTTTNATVTTLATIAIAADYTYDIWARVTARRTGGTAGTADDGARYVRLGTYTTKSGTVTLMGAVEAIGTDREDQAGWDCTLDISGTNVRVRVTGAANNNITWLGEIAVQRVSS